MNLLKKINIIWTAGDIEYQAINDGFILSKKEISDVLSLLKYDHDATIGINWNVISYAIKEIVEERNNK
jgi:hypothetical protein